MKVLAFVDMHGNMKALEHIKLKGKMADLIICAGDISLFERRLEELISEVASIGKPVILLNGNHESFHVLKDLTKIYENVLFLHKATYEIGNYVFIGYGGGGFSTLDDDFTEFVSKIKLKNKKAILITHGPPHGTAVDYLGSHVGNKSYSNFIMEFQPILSISGHIHETAGKEDKIGKTRIINPGPFGKIIEI